MENNEQGTGHRAQSQETLSKIADSLLYDVVGNTDSLSLVCVVFVSYLASDAEGSGVERRLGNETIRKWDAKNSSNKGRETEQPNVPVEASRLFKRELCALGDER